VSGDIVSLSGLLLLSASWTSRSQGLDLARTLLGTDDGALSGIVHLLISILVKFSITTVVSGPKISR
jgi:hypothetical protein